MSKLFILAIIATLCISSCQSYPKGSQSYKAKKARKCNRQKGIMTNMGGVL